MDYSYFSNPPVTYSYAGTYSPAAVPAPMETVEDRLQDRSRSMTAQPYPTYLAHSPYQNTLDAPGPAGSRLDPRGSMTFSSRIRSVSAEGDMERHPRSSSEERDSLTPAQSRRKAQNRAAQRAFRERKERHVKDLEQRVATLEQKSSSLAADNERLKRELDQVTHENDFLRRARSSPRIPTVESAPPTPAPAIGPIAYYSSTAVYNAMQAQPPSAPGHRIVVAEQSEQPLLGTNATWDFIQSHTLFKQGLVDVATISERLKAVVRCDGQGPAFDESDIVTAIEASMISE